MRPMRRLVGSECGVDSKGRIQTKPRITITSVLGRNNFETITWI